MLVIGPENAKSGETESFPGIKGKPKHPPRTNGTTLQNRPWTTRTSLQTIPQVLEIVLSNEEIIKIDLPQLLLLQLR
jgi:hypothetical protein